MYFSQPTFYLWIKTLKGIKEKSYRLYKCNHRMAMNSILPSHIIVVVYKMLFQELEKSEFLLYNIITVNFYVIVNGDNISLYLSMNKNINSLYI